MVGYWSRGRDRRCVVDSEWTSPDLSTLAIARIPDASLFGNSGCQTLESCRRNFVGLCSECHSFPDPFNLRVSGRFPELSVQGRLVRGSGPGDRLPLSHLV